MNDLSSVNDALSSESKAAAVNALARSKRTLRAAVDRCVALGVVAGSNPGGRTTGSRPRRRPMRTVDGW